MKPRKKLYEFHTANLRAVSAALDRVAASTRTAIASNVPPEIETFTRLYAMLLGAWAECRLAKLLYHPNAYNDADCQTVRNQSTHLDRWHKVVELAFRKHYIIPHAALSENTLTHSAYSRYRTISTLLNGELHFVITLRNKLAHGQWIYPLNDQWDDVAQVQMDALRTENLLSLKFKKVILDALLNAIADLALSLPTFDRDFDNHYRQIQNAQRDLRTRSFADYSASLQSKYQRGRAKRAAP
ncbi:MAG: hypothetical protein JNM43_20045 [Planctomycetaceae bacterium]|nr:hypothetical protein [Planctomycetaceae bacterium]